MQVEKSHVPYSKNFLKKLINEIESAHGDILDELYEQYASYMILLKVKCSISGWAGYCLFLSQLVWNYKILTCHILGWQVGERKLKGLEMHFISYSSRYELLVVRCLLLEFLESLCTSSCLIDVIVLL